MRLGLLLAAAAALAVGIPAISGKTVAHVPAVQPSANAATAVPLGQGMMIQPLPMNIPRQAQWDTPCTDDCSGHDAGYQWAEDNAIGDADDCEGKSQSFIDGCVQYVEENKDGDEVLAGDN